jgi:hypothetical protein
VNSSNYIKVMLTPNVTFVMAITLELTVEVLALRETLFGKKSIEVLASAQVISEGCPTVALYVAGSAIEGRSPPIALHLVTVPLLYRNSLPIPNAQSRARPRLGRLANPIYKTRDRYITSN